jgi:hypothetical protein
VEVVAERARFVSLVMFSKWRRWWSRSGSVGRLMSTRRPGHDDCRTFFVTLWRLHADREHAGAREVTQGDPEAPSQNVTPLRR